MKIGFGSRKISSLPWETLGNLKSLEHEAAKVALDQFRFNYVLPQVMALLAKQVALIRNENGKFSTTLTMKNMSSQIDKGLVVFDDGAIVTKAIFNGILQFIRYNSRSYILPALAKQISPEWARFSSAVPLFMSAFKEYRNVKYSDWDLTDEWLCYTTDDRMHELLKTVGSEIGYTNDELLAFQRQGRTIKTGAKAGTIKHLNSTTAITGIADEEFASLPALVKLLLCQAWVFQPGLYHKLGIYNLNDPDAKAASLISTEIVEHIPSLGSAGYGWDE